MLTDNVLVEIFDFYRNNHDHTRHTVWKWHLLVHVCQRWRQVVFASPHRLNLQILCTERTPVRKNLCIWPVFPIVIVFYRYSWSGLTSNDEDNVTAALEHRDRVCYLFVDVTGLQLEKIATAIQKPFPVLTDLIIVKRDEGALVLPDGFLGGSAPCLQQIHLHGIHYPALPTLLLSTSDLVSLRLRHIPPTGYISPEAMVVGLAALPRLKFFYIEFQSTTSLPDRIRPSPVTRTVLPALALFRFRGASEYLEDLLARIDGPQLIRIDISYSNDLSDFQVAQLSKFVHRSVGFELTPFRRARVSPFSGWVDFTLHHPNYPGRDRRSRPGICISCGASYWQVSHRAQVLSQFSATLSPFVHLELGVHFEPGARLEEDRPLEGTDNFEWLQLLHPFSTVQTLHVSRRVAGHVAHALEDTTGEMVAEVLPSLDLIYLAGQPASSIEKFVAARQFSDRPVTVVDTDTEFNKRLES